MTAYIISAIVISSVPRLAVLFSFFGSDDLPLTTVSLSGGLPVNHIRGLQEEQSNERKEEED